MTSKLEKYLEFIPDKLKPQTNPMLNALLSAWAGADEEITTQLQNTKAQLFVKTAEGVYLDRVASGVGVSRPGSLGLLDEDFRKLIPNLSFKQKQIVKAFYDTMDIFWGPLFSRANIRTTTFEPFNVITGDKLQVIIDGGAIQETEILVGDIANDTAATAQELVRVFSRIPNMTTAILEDPATGDKQLSFRTNTPGPRGSIYIESAPAGLGLTIGVENLITDLAQRSVVYQVRPGELTIEIPAIVPTLRRTLKGSHHFHADATLEGPVAPGNGVWAGSFLYSTTLSPFVVTGTKAVLEETVLKGSVLTEITVDDTEGFPASGGELIFNFGRENQERPVDFITIPNSKTILIDPGYTFQFTHLVGSEVNLLRPNQTAPYKPRRDGTDLAIYLTSPSNSRQIVQNLLKSLAAAGIVINFLILLPEYRYILDNPFD